MPTFGPFPAYLLCRLSSDLETSSAFALHPSVADLFARYRGALRRHTLGLWRCPRCDRRPAVDSSPLEETLRKLIRHKSRRRQRK